MNFPVISTALNENTRIGLIFQTANMQSAPEEKLATEGCEVGPRRFVVGRVYGTRSICDSECIFRWTVTRRTAKSVWIKSVRVNTAGQFEAYGEATRRALDTDYDGENELIYPSGRYSMCPILTADKGDLA